MAVNDVEGAFITKVPNVGTAWRRNRGLSPEPRVRCEILLLNPAAW